MLAAGDVEMASGCSTPSGADNDGIHHFICIILLTWSMTTGDDHIPTLPAETLGLVGVVAGNREELGLAGLGLVGDAQDSAHAL